ncbi:MAG: ROK family protein [Acidimicrobiia bacterium]|nr:MAG: ROK family protein [Acidimicrobiia bacterium]
MAYGGIEGGGTKFVCVVGTGPDDVTASTTFATTTPDETLSDVSGFFSAHDIAALGVATFGPLDLDPASPTYGHLLVTPKSRWSGFDVVGTLARALGVPVAIDTDVNGAAIGEGRWGVGQGLDTFLYVTVGTGIGGGGLIGGKPMHGLTHPEIGHMRIPRHPDDPFPGNCPNHGDCLEGLAAGPAIAERWGRPADDLGEHAEAATVFEAFYLGVAMNNLTLTISPQRIIIGGGVLGMPGLLEATRTVMLDTLAGYVQLPSDDASDYLITPGLGRRSGVLGALVLAGA